MSLPGEYGCFILYRDLKADLILLEEVDNENKAKEEVESWLEKCSFEAFQEILEIHIIDTRKSEFNFDKLRVSKLKKEEERIEERERAEYERLRKKYEKRDRWDFHKFHSKTTQRRLRAGARGFDVDVSKLEDCSSDELVKKKDELCQAIVALQSLDDLGSAEDNQKAWDDMNELQRRENLIDEILDKRLNEETEGMELEQIEEGE